MCSDTFENLLRPVEEILCRLRNLGLTVKPEKVKLAVHEISFFGAHFLSQRDQDRP